MIKSITIYCVVFFLVYVTSLSIHNYVIQKQQIILCFSLNKVYLFYFLFSLVLCTKFKLLSSIPKIFSQLGFIYLITILLKLILFCGLFYEVIFKNQLSLSTRISLCVPTLLFLIIEVFFVAKILKNNNP